MINPFCDVSSLMYMFKSWDERKIMATQEKIIRSEFKKFGHNYEKEITIYQGYAIYSAMYKYAMPLVKKAFDLSVCDLPDDEQRKLWEQFKKENKL